MEYKGYTARVTFDEEAGVLFGEVEGLRDVVTFEATNVEDLPAAFRDSVDDYIAMCAERGEKPEKPYSGKFLVRVDPRLHREVAMAAARSGKSLNAFTSEVLRTWIQGEQREALRKSPATATTRTRSLSEELREYLSASPGGFVADVQDAVWGESTRDTPASITPARRSDTLPTSNTPQSRTPSSKPSTRKVA